MPVPRSTLARLAAAALASATPSPVLALSAATPPPTHRGDDMPDSKTDHATPPLAPALVAYLDARAAEFDQIDPARKAELEAFGAQVAGALAKDHSARLTFICTHNSRRSHMAQLWAAAAAARVGLAGVETFSGGTEATAFNPRAVAALRRAGFEIRATDESANPRYEVRMRDASSDGDETPMVCFSKIYDQNPNPKADFGAVMVCDSANEACPVVFGADFRTPIMYVDPKAHDNTPKEAWAYDTRCAQIAREMLYAMTRAAGGAAEGRPAAAVPTRSH